MNTQDRLCPQETTELLSRYRNKGDTAARDRVVEAHLYLAQIIARKFSGRGVEYDDLVQVASLALLKAAERFDPERGVQFSTFATPAMVGEVKNYFRDKSGIIRPPRRAGELAKIVGRATERLTQELHRAPRVDEIALKADLTEDEVLEGLEAAAFQPVSLDAQISGEDGEMALERVLGAEEAGYGETELRDAVGRALRELPERQREVLKLRFFQGLSQREAAERLGISQMTVSREERAALEAIKTQIG